MEIDLVIFSGFAIIDAFGILRGPTLQLTATVGSYQKYTITGSVDFRARVVRTHTVCTTPRLKTLTCFLLQKASAASTRLSVALVARAHPKLKYLLGICNIVSIAGSSREAGVNEQAEVPSDCDSWAKMQAVYVGRYIIGEYCWTSSEVSAGID